MMAYRWRGYRQVALVVALVLMFGWLPGAPRRAIAAQPQLSQQPAPNLQPPATRANEPPPIDSHLPSLSLQLDIAPDPLAVGATAAITLTIANVAPNAADDLEINLPAPEGVVALPGAGLVGPSRGWRWALGRLDAHTRVSVTGSLRLVNMPPDGAILLRAQAVACGLAQPVYGIAGVLAVEPAGQPAAVSLIPGAPAVLRSRDGRVTVQIPASAVSHRLTLRHAAIAPGTNQLPTIAGFKRGLGVFSLSSVDSSGNPAQPPATPLTITARYSLAQLEARRIAEANLTFFHFDQAQGRWIALPTTVDQINQTASVTAIPDGFFELGDGSSPSTTFVPTLQGWQTNLFTGAAGYAMPIDLPAGPGGLKPQLQLTYNSAQTDGDYHLFTHKQAGWAGKGWDLSTGYIALNKMSGDDYFSLVLNGKSSPIARGKRLSGANYSSNWLQGWEWFATDENFTKIRAVYKGDYAGPPAGKAPRNVWVVWTRDGTRYEFNQDVTWLWNDETGACGTYETYKWMLSKITDPSGNTIVYNYTPVNVTTDCYNNIAVQPDIYLSSILWAYDGSTPGAGAPRYKVIFDSSWRSAGGNTVAPAEDMA